MVVAQCFSTVALVNKVTNLRVAECENRKWKRRSADNMSTSPTGTPELCGHMITGHRSLYTVCRCRSSTWTRR